MPSWDHYDRYDQPAWDYYDSYDRPEFDFDYAYDDYKPRSGSWFGFGSGSPWMRSGRNGRYDRYGRYGRHGRQRRGSRHYRRRRESWTERSPGGMCVCM
ncbi:hypothetical protein EJ04DRAFT_509690 [Polyplosphaeria fusca]|uniref:Uncharacterized protein n=1 Tax=Polyplosphaeria fusca TaxID=682080 RepID=A0A9P4V500_9PLEO|nr:hypothetical protein EJ04DRAFT_509690 [Polyplosphaeria fusca]